MYFRFRHIFLTSIALCLLASCSAEDPDKPATGAAMEFAVGAEKRSSQTDNSGLSPFCVFGDMKRLDGGALMKVLENVLITYNQSTNRWEYDETQYWFPYMEYSFVAFYPTPLLSMPGADARYSNSTLNFTYALPADYKQTPDILVATHRRKCISGEAETVRLQFCHLLTKINIAPMLDDSEMGSGDYLQFHKVELTGYPTKTTFGITPASLQSNSQTDDLVITSEPDNSSANGNLVFEFPEPKKHFNHREPLNLFDDDTIIMMLPQTFAATSEAQIILTYTISGSSLENQLVVPLSGLNWGAGKSYTYNLIIDKWGLKMLTPTITDWEVKSDSFDAIIN